MDLDLDRLLAATRAGQWSLEELDWSRPLEGAGRLAPADRRSLGLALLFTAGLEEQAARVFELCADHVDDERARAIYRLFADDERRHAAAERRLAARFGVAPAELPRAVRWMFATLARNFDAPGRGVHEVSAATILLFELGLDTLLVPALREKVADPLQEEVFRRIDRDESRHLAMDYWLLDRKGEQFRGRPLAEVIEAEDGPRSALDRLRGRYILWRTMIAFLVGFAANGAALHGLSRDLNDPERLRRYLRRVRDVPRKAPRALDATAYRMGLRGQRFILGLIARTGPEVARVIEEERAGG